MQVSCPSRLLLAMYADGALEAAAAGEVERHVDRCAACRALTAGLRAEAALLRAALRREEPVRIPAFHRPLGALGWLVLALGGAVVAVSAADAWSAIAAAVPPGVRWLNPLAPGGLFDLAVSVCFFVANEGAAMLNFAASLAAAGIVLAAAFAAALALGRRRTGAAALLPLVLLVAAPEDGHTIEIRRGMPVMTVPTGETVADTLIVIGESVAVDGNVEGDLIVFARRVTVRGNVTGSLIGAAETVTIEGTVGGNLVGFGRAVTLAGARVERNLYGFARDVSIGTTAQVAGNAVAFGETVGMHGRVGVDLLSFSRSLEVGGEVVRDVEAHAADVVLLPAARVGGDVTAHVPGEDDLRASSGSAVRGEVAAEVPEEPRSKYFTPSFYAGQALRLGALFLAGLLVLWLFSGLREVTLRDAGDGLAAAGRGLVTASVLPIVSLVLVITIVGIPLGLLGFLIWGLALYFGKVIVAQLIGRQLFRAPNGAPHYATTLIAGLVIVMIAVNLPFVGPIVHVAVTLVGLGLLTRYALGHVGPRAA